MKKRWFAIVLLVLIVAVFGYRRFRGPTPPPAETAAGNYQARPGIFPRVGR
jgi:hypothetical protein